MEIKLTNQHILNIPICVALSSKYSCESVPENLQPIIEYYKQNTPDACKLGHFSNIITTNANNEYTKALLFGFDVDTTPTEEKIRELGGNTIRAIETSKNSSLIIYLPEQIFENQPENIAAFTQGLILGSYKFDILKSTPSTNNTPETIHIYCSNLSPAVISAFKEALTVSANVILTRDLTNLPANILTPKELTEKADRIMKKLSNINSRILNAEDMEKLGMNALLAVAKGSKNQPYMSVITYRGNKNTKEMLALVGKGVTFDSGGISIKPADKMWEMTGDMCGAATVLGAIKTIAELQLNCNVMAIMPCVENMPSGTAYRPGDVIEAMNGKSIEIHSTDAEGRLILADAVCYAEQLGATKIIDVATLTGACSIAVGDLYAATISNSYKLHQYLELASQKTGEKIWMLPAAPEYKELLKSDIADLKNSAGRSAGTITGGLFIGEFVTKDWVHIDIASTSDTDKTSGYKIKGATGYGVRLLVQAVKELFIC